MAKITTVFNIPKKQSAAFSAVYCVFVFSQFFIMPMELYLRNLPVFSISAAHIAIPLLITALCILTALLLVLPVIFRGIGLDIVTLLLLGALFASYIQIMFLNGEMPMLTGDPVDYGETAVVVNLFVWLFLFFLPLLIWKGLRDSKKYKNIQWERPVIAVSMIIACLLSAEAVTKAIGYDPGVLPGAYEFSYDKSFELSSDENICVFIMDRLDVKYMDDYLEQNRKWYEILDGFTYYRNNVSLFAHTYPSVTVMLTDADYFEYAGRLPNVFINKAWEGRNFIDIMRDNGYGSALLIDKNGVYGDIANIENRTDNITYKQADDEDVGIIYTNVIRCSLALSVSRCVPYLVKHYFNYNIKPGFSYSFYEWHSDDTFFEKATAESDARYLKRLQTTGLRLQNNTKMFTLTHFYSAHSISDMHISFDAVAEFITQMKELSIYDNSTIILIADHGRAPVNAEIRYADNMQDVITSSLIIKPKNSRGILNIDSKQELSHQNFIAGILHIAGLPYEEYGLSYFDIIEGNIPQERYFYPHTFYAAQDYVDVRNKYVIKGDANDFDNWEYTPYDGQN